MKNRRILTFCAIALLISAFAAINSLQAECPCAVKTDELLAIAVEAPDATSDVAIPERATQKTAVAEPAKADDNVEYPSLVTNKPQAPAPVQVQGPQPVSYRPGENVDLDLDYVLALQILREKEQRILDDPRVKPLIAALRENTPEYDKCVSLCQYLFTTIEKIEKAGNDDQSEFIVMAKWSLGDVMRDLRELGLDPTGLKDMVEAAGGDFDRPLGAQPPITSECPTCPKREELDRQMAEKQSPDGIDWEREKALRAQLNEAPSPKDWGQGGMFHGRNPEDEIISKRAKNTKHFKNSDGSYDAVISGGSIHYEEDGLFKEIDIRIKPNDDSEYPFANTTNTVKSFFPGENLGRDGIRIGTDENSMYLSKNPSIVWFAPDNSIQILEKAKSVNADVKNNHVIYNNSFSTGDIEFVVNNDIVKHNVILNSLPEYAADLEGFIGFSEEISLPEGWYLMSGKEKINSETTVSGAITIYNSSGEFVYFFPVPEVYEANNPSVSLINPDGTSSTGKTYYIKPTCDGFQIVALVPAEWLKARSFPVIIDPDATVYGNYGGWLGTASGYVEGNPSIYVYVDSTHRAWTRFDITSIPDAATISAVVLRLYCNNVGATTAVTVSINDVTGTIGPYGSWNSTAATDLGNGPYTSFSCTSASVTYGPYTLGSTANTHLQGRLAGNLFQIGLSSASTTYKRFTSNSNYIVVTYATCTTPANPGNPTVTSYNCGSTTLTRNGTPTAPLYYYWQGTSCGTSTAYGNGATYSATTLGTNTYYIKAYNSGCWSTGCGSVSAAVYGNMTALNGRVNGSTSATICAEDPVNLTYYSQSGGNCSGSYSWQYQWYHSGTAWTSSWSTSATTSHRPTHTGYYYLRGRCSVCGTGTYYTSTSYYVTVTAPSYTTAAASASPSPACIGVPVTLTANNNGCGGRYYWTLAVTPNACASRATCNTATFAQYSDYGSNTLSWTPTAAGTYQFQVERRANVNGTWIGTAGYGCVQITVNTPPSAPTSITNTGTTICNGTTLSLSASGGSAGSGCSYQWYAGGCGSGSVLGTGVSLNVTPSATTTYYVRRVGNTPCNGTVTACASGTVTVQQPPTAPTSITGSGVTVCNGVGVNLTAAGGSAGSGCSYQWYAGGCGSGSVLGTGSTLTVNPTTTTTYYVRRVGNTACTNTTGCASGSVSIYNNGVAEGTWVGQASNTWGNCANWGSGKEPISTTNVTVNTGVSNWPYVTASGEVCNNLTVNSGAQLFINSGSLAFGSGGYIYNYGTITMAGGTLSGYRFQNYGGTINLNGGTTTLTSYLYNISGYPGNVINITGSAVVNTVSMPNYSGIINHTGGTINNTGYYNDNGTAGGRYYGSGTATFHLSGTSNNYIYIRATTAPLTYFNNLTISNLQYMNGSTTQPLDVNGTFLINTGATFQATGKEMLMSGNWTNNGTFTPGGNRVTFDGSGSNAITIGGSAVTPFNDLYITKTAGTVSLGQNISVSGELNTDSGSNVGIQTSSYEINVDP